MQYKRYIWRFQHPFKPFVITFIWSMILLIILHFAIILLLHRYIISLQIEFFNSWAWLPWKRPAMKMIPDTGNQRWSITVKDVIIKSTYSYRFLAIDYAVLHIDVSFEFRVLYWVFTESQNGCKEPLEITLSKPPAQAGSPRASCQLCSVKFWVCA